MQVGRGRLNHRAEANTFPNLCMGPHAVIRALGNCTHVRRLAQGLEAWRRPG